MDYRIKQNVKIARLPKGFQEDQRGLKNKRACHELALASDSDKENWKNDIKGVFLKKSDPADTVEFILEKCGTGVVSNEGYVPVFPNDPLAVGFVYEWQKVLLAHGVGEYTISVNFTIAGIQDLQCLHLIDLVRYSIFSARGTIRSWAEFDSFYVKQDIDFTDSDFRDSVRCNGYFGDRQPETEVNNLIGNKRRIEKTTRENLNVLTFRTDPVGICITRQLVDLHFLNEDRLLITDHNQSNHDYILLDKEMVVSESANFEYFDGSRLAKLSIALTERDLLDKSYFR